MTVYYVLFVQKNLIPTLPEREGWVNREELHDFSGRSRKPQFELAKKFGFEDFAQPAGGCCFLTDANYSKKLADLWEARGERRYELDDIMLLKVGRHIRPKKGFLKLIVSREEGENNFLRGYKKQFTSIHTVSHGGPLTLLDGEFDKDDVKLAAQIAARYSGGKNAEHVTVQVENYKGTSYVIDVPPLSADDV